MSPLVAATPYGREQSTAFPSPVTAREQPAPPTGAVVLAAGYPPLSAAPAAWPAALSSAGGQTAAPSAASAPTASAAVASPVAAVLRAGRAPATIAASIRVFLRAYIVGMAQRLHVAASEVFSVRATAAAAAATKKWRGWGASAPAPPPPPQPPPPPLPVKRTISLAPVSKALRRLIALALLATLPSPARTRLTCGGVPVRVAPNGAYRHGTIASDNTFFKS